MQKSTAAIPPPGLLGPGTLIRIKKVNIIECRDLSFSYESEPEPALTDIDIEVSKGELVAVLGHNGCGKSTLIKHFNALLPLQTGSLRVAEIDISGDCDIWELRRKAGMVFQNPDNQFVSSVVEDDVAFGLENYLVPREKIAGIVEDALKNVDMTGFEKRATHTLSGGQKQRVALAGVLALDPDILIFDEATSMLDPEGRDEVMRIIGELRTKQGKTVIIVTHFIEECVHADRIIVMKEGRVVASGTPGEILPNRDVLKETGLVPPLPVRVYLDLRDKGIILPRCPLTEAELIEMLCQYN
jgi:energy-coupling factor transport system ATP-binding protein